VNNDVCVRDGVVEAELARTRQPRRRCGQSIHKQHAIFADNFRGALDRENPVDEEGAVPVAAGAMGCGCEQHVTR